MRVKDPAMFIPNDAVMVEWDDKYATGIKLIDEQHRELIRLTNELYEACLEGNEAARDVCRDAIRRTVDYIRYHFGAEEKLLERIGYPETAYHKKAHEILIRNVLDTVKDFEEGKKYVPNNFARTLKDWILTHIAMADRQYALYAADLKKRGLLDEGLLQN